MDIKEIGRGVMFTYTANESPIGEYSTYLVNGDNNLYLCDSFLGPKSMEPIKDYIADQGWQDKPMVVFLSHSDWDHVWGTCAFAGATVIAHDKCAQRMYDRGQLELERYAQYQEGEIRLIYPSLTFENRISFREDGMDFIYAPGHTVDSAICLNRRDSTLFVGDLVERPQPVISHHDLETYIDTLERLQGLKAETMISSHSGLVTEQDIKDNIQSIRDFQELAQAADKDEDSIEHKLYTLLMYEDAIQQTTGDSFDYISFQKDLWKSLEKDYLSSEMALLRSVTHEDLELALQSYMAGL